MDSPKTSSSSSSITDSNSSEIANLENEIQILKSEIIKINDKINNIHTTLLEIKFMHVKKEPANCCNGSSFNLGINT